MARLDIRVDGRTRFSRSVDNAAVDRVLAAAVTEPAPEPEVTRNFGGKVVKVSRPRKAKPEEVSVEEVDTVTVSDSAESSDDQHS